MLFPKKAAVTAAAVSNEYKIQDPRIQENEKTRK
jgi:hypothetical protein